MDFSYKWSHTAILMLLRSATNIVLIEILSEYHDLKKDIFQQEDVRVERMQKEDCSLSTEEIAFTIQKWFILNDTTANELLLLSPMQKDSIHPNASVNVEETEFVYSVAKKSTPETNITSPVIYDFRTPQDSKTTKQETSKALVAVEEVSRGPESIVDCSIIFSRIPEFSPTIVG